MLFCLPGIAADYQPAMIGDHDNALANKITFPDVPGDFTVFVRCEAKVMPQGAVDEVACYSDPNVDEAFFRAVHLGAKMASFAPAKVDGERVPVLALFSVVFKQEGENRVMAVIPNHGTNAKSLGMNYIAPQKYNRNNNFLPRGELGLVWVDATMTPAGKLKSVSYVETDWSNRETKRYAKHYVKDNTFIPGFANGQPVEMRFLKPIYGYRNGFTYAGVDNRCRDTLISCDEISSTTGRPRFVFDD